MSAYIYERSQNASKLHSTLIYAPQIPWRRLGQGVAGVGHPRVRATSTEASTHLDKGITSDQICAAVNIFRAHDRRSR